MTDIEGFKAAQMHELIPLGRNIYFAEREGLSEFGNW